MNNNKNNNSSSRRKHVVSERLHVHRNGNTKTVYTQSVDYMEISAYNSPIMCDSIAFENAQNNQQNVPGSVSNNVAKHETAKLMIASEATRRCYHHHYSHSYWWCCFSAEHVRLARSINMFVVFGFLASSSLWCLNKLYYQLFICRIIEYLSLLPSPLLSLPPPTSSLRQDSNIE